MNIGQLSPECRAASPIATMVVATDVLFTLSLSTSEQETVKSTFKSQLEAWYSSLSLVFTVTLQTSRRNATYSLSGTTETNNPSAASSTSTSGLNSALASELSIALPSITISVSGVVTSVSKPESIEDDAEENGSGGGMWIDFLIGMGLGAIVIAGAVGAIVHCELSRRFTTSQINDSHGNKSQTDPDHGIYIDHVAGHQVADVDLCLSEVAYLESNKEPSDQYFSKLTTSGSDSSDVESDSGLEQSFNELSTTSDFYNGASHGFAYSA